MCLNIIENFNSNTNKKFPVHFLLEEFTQIAKIAHLFKDQGTLNVDFLKNTKYFEYL